MRWLVVAVVVLALAGAGAFFDLRSEARAAREESRQLAAEIARRDVRDACGVVAGVEQQLAVRAETPKAQLAAEAALDGAFGMALRLAEGEPGAHDTIAAFGAALGEFLAADHAGDGVARESALHKAGERLGDVRGLCGGVELALDWDLPKTGRGRAYPATAPGTRLVEDLECDWWGSASTMSAPYCVFGSADRGTYSLTGRVEAGTGGGAGIPNAQVAYHVQGLRRPVVTWSDQAGDYAFYGIPLRGDGRVTCAWRVTKAEGFGTEIYVEYLSGHAYGGSIYLDDDREVFHDGYPYFPERCETWVPRAFDRRFDVSPIADDP